MSNAIQRLKEHPRGFWFIFWGELAERASYYGMRTILTLYLVSILGFAGPESALIMHLFIAGCYLAPLLGGLLADRVLGRYKTILYFSPPYILGHIIIGGWDTRPAMFIALVLLALGAGSIKPNISTLMGQMYEEQKKQALLTEAFSYYYAAVNIGAAISSLALPVVRDSIAKTEGLTKGYAVAFMIPAILMVLAFVLFASGKKYYPQDVVRNLPKKTPEQRAAERMTLARIGGVFAVIALFWFVYDQTASTWVLFAKDHMDLNLIGDLSTTADQIQGLNPVFIVVLTPFFNWLWNFIKDRRGVEMPDTRKMMAGFFILIGCLALMAVAAYASSATSVSVWWMCIATLVVTMAELCISVVGLEFAFKQAAPGTKSFVTGVFWLTVFVGDLGAAAFSEALWGTVSAGNFFALQTAIVIAAAAAFYVVARKFEREGDTSAPAPIASSEAISS
jgi:POT family proton-dependent oligopeptide transporter